MIGTQLSHFRITGKLGEGGMGEVWRAEDLRLDREVAIKVLPEEVSTDPDRLQRLEREARVLASLTHPHIAALYDVGEDGGRHFLVMELVAGDTLAERIERGPLAVDEALRVAGQVADALEAAHERGVVHRDLKPDNVKLDPEGRVKVLDFGLAKAMEREPGAGQGAELTRSPTLTYQVSGGGLLLGTAAYMSPEQARGQAADARSDLWALGVLLWEMLTGHRPFAGATVTDLLAAVLRDDPPWGELPPGLPAPVRWLLRHALERDPRRRLRSAADAALLLDKAGAGVEVEVPARPAAGRGWLVGAALLGVALGALGLWALAGREAPVPAPTYRLSVVEPRFYDQSRIALSPDGRTLALAASDEEGAIHLVLRSLGRFESTPIPGSEGGRNPFFSPDGRWVAFFNREQLMKVPVAGGTPVPICRVAGKVRFDPWSANEWPEGTWGEDGTIVFSTGYWRSPYDVPGLYRVPAGGGVPEPLLGLDVEGGEEGQLSPRFVPGSRWVLFTGAGARYTIGAVSLETDERRTLLEDAGAPIALASGRLVYMDSFFTRLLVAPFDLRKARLTGPGIPLLERLPTDVPIPVDVSANGNLAFLPGGGGKGEYRLVEADRDGRRAPLGVRLGAWLQPHFTPGGRSLVVRELGDDCRLWRFDLERQVLSKLTYEGDDHAPAVSPDGRWLAFSRQGEEEELRSLWVQPLGGRGEPIRVAQGTSGGDLMYPMTWTSDGRSLLVADQSLETDVDLSIVEAKEGASPRPFLQSRFVEIGGSFSPDGRWLAYSSDETGRLEVYAVRFPSGNGKVQVSRDGGSDPRWAAGSGEIFYIREMSMMAVAAKEQGDELILGAPQELFRGNYPLDNPGNYDVTADGKRFVFPEPAAGSSEEIRVVVGWGAELDRRR